MPILNPGTPKDGRRVVPSLLELADDDGEGARREQLRAQRLEPAEDLPLRRQQVVERRHERPGPRAGGYDQRTCLVRATGGLDAHRVAGGVPLQHRLAGPHVGAALQRDGHVRDNAPFRHEEPAVRLVHGHPLRRKPAAGKTSSNLLATEGLVRQVVLDAGRQGAAEHRALGPARVHGAGDVQKLLAGRRLQFTPTLVGAAEQGHVGRVLGVGEPDDAADAMRRAAVVGDVETLQPQHAEAAACELIHRRGAHRAHANHDDVVGTVGGHGCETGGRPNSRADGPNDSG